MLFFLFCNTFAKICQDFATFDKNLAISGHFLAGKLFRIRQISYPGLDFTRDQSFVIFRHLFYLFIAFFLWKRFFTGERVACKGVLGACVSDVCTQSTIVGSPSLYVLSIFGFCFFAIRDPQGVQQMAFFPAPPRQKPGCRVQQKRPHLLWIL